MLVITQDGEQLGVKPRIEALKEAEKRGLDLVLVAPNAKPPVCRIMDYSKYRYEKQRKAREAKKNQKVVELKEIRLSPTIDIHDFETKLKNGRKFLVKGDRLKVTLRFRGRSIAFKDQGLAKINDFAAKCEDVATVEKKATFEGRSVFLILAPINKKQ